MTWRAENPWRCWDRMSMPGIINGPEGLIVRVAMFDARTSLYQSEFRWPALVRLGPNDYAGQYAQVTLRFGNVKWSFEMAREAQRIYILVRAVDGPAEHIQVRLETLYVPAEAGRVLTQEQDVVGRSDKGAWRIWSPTISAKRIGTTITSPLARPFVGVIEPMQEGVRNEQRTVHEHRAGSAAQQMTPMERQAIDRVRQARTAYLAKFSFVPREMWWIYAAIPYGIGWDMIWAADRQEPIQVCSRDWCVHGTYGEWVLFNWDTFLLPAATAEYDIELTKQILRPQFAVQTADGMVPGIACPWGVSGDRAMPPTAALGIWKAYLRCGERSLVEEFYEPTKRYQEWWWKRRDGNGDGLLEWGSHPAELIHPQWQAHTAWAARYETGMDNHAMWDDTVFNEKTSTQEQSDVGLNALQAANARCLAKMAALLGRIDDAQKFENEAASLSRRIDDQLWNDDEGLWLSRKWDGTWVHRASPCCFYPMLNPVDRARAERAVREHVENPQRFGGRYIMPVSPRNDPAYPEQYYLRGRIWPPQTMIVHWALRECGLEDAAKRLANGCVETFRHEWLDKSHLHENYNAETSDAEDTPESDPVYSFGVMLPMAAWHQVRDRTIDGKEVKGGMESLEQNLDREGRLRARIDLQD